MTHYVCTGECKGVADYQKNCDTASCSMYQKPLIECHCTDGQHQEVKKGYNQSMLNLSSMMIGSSQPKVLGEFYEKVFGKPADMHEDTWYGWKSGHTFLNIGEHSEVKGASKDPSRIIINFETEDVKGEFARISKFATVVKAPYQMETAWIATLQDPDGNYFQLMSPWKSDK